MKVCGLVLNPPNGTEARQVDVHDEADWQMIYKTPSIRVKCLVETCDTLLTPKRMSRSGLRFLAIRSGGCSHNLVKIPVLDQDVEQDPSTLVGGGGPEGEEHLWVKGRLFRIGRLLGLNPIEEDGLTRADVFLSKPRIALEYQRWDTDFTGRTEQRTQAGASATIWMFPAQRPGEPWTKRAAAFRQQVWEAGGIYIAVKNQDDRRAHLSPWEHPDQERSARLYVSGSIVRFDQELGHLVRTELSIAPVLAQIASGERALKRVPVFTKKTGKISWASVWVAYGDYRAMATAYEQLRQANTEAEAAAGSAADASKEAELPHGSEAAASQEITTELAMGEQAQEASPVVVGLQGARPHPLAATLVTASGERSRKSSVPQESWWEKLLRLFRGE